MLIIFPYGGFHVRHLQVARNDSVVQLEKLHYEHDLAQIEYQVFVLGDHHEVADSLIQVEVPQKNQNDATIVVRE
jgi:hypothetical protein